ncbi:MAG: T9SS type A sorting domain-containing protein [Sumerlaeia bacterium]
MAQTFLDLGSPVTGSIEAGLPADQIFDDFYLLMPGAGVLDATLTATSIAGGGDTLDLEIWTVSGTLLYRRNVTAGASRQIVTRSLSPAVYRVRVQGRPSGGWDGADYELTVASNLIGSDLGENRSDAAAIPNTGLDGGIRVTHNFSATGDVDWFAAAVPDDGGTLEVAFSNIAGSLSFTVQDSSGATLLSRSNLNGSPSPSVLNGLPRGPYFIRATGNSGTYRVRAIYQASPGSSVIDDVGGALSQAWPLPLDQPLTLELETTDPGPRDRFAIYVPYAGPFEAQAFNIHRGGDTDQIVLQLRDRAGLLRGASTQTGDSAKVVSQNLSPGLYYLDVVGTASGAWDGGLYTVIASAPAGADDVPNNRGQALQLGAQPFSGAIQGNNDRDVFAVFLKDQGDAAAALDVVVDRMSGNGVNVEIYDAQGIRLTYNNQSGTTDEVIQIGNLAKGFYFLEVFASNSANYRIRATTNANPSSGVTDDVGDAIASALPLPLGYLFQGVLDPQASNDTDVFSFRLARAGSIRARVIGGAVAASDEDLKLDLRTVQGTILGTSDAARSQDETVELASAVAGEYVAVVTSERSGDFDGAAYHLVVSLDVPLGDVSGDGTVSAFDASLIRQHLKGSVSLNTDQLEAADVIAPFDVVDETDARAILNYVANPEGGFVAGS